MNWYKKAQRSENHSLDEIIGYVDRALMGLGYEDIDPLSMSHNELLSHLQTNNRIPPGINPDRFVSAVQFKARQPNLEEEISELPKKKHNELVQTKPS